MLGHVLAEELRWPWHEPTSTEAHRSAGGSTPGTRAPDQPGANGVEQGVGQLVEHVSMLEQVDGVVGVAAPERLPAALAQLTARASNELRYCWNSGKRASGSVTTRW